MQIAGLVLLTVLLVIGVFPIALYVGVAGGYVSIPMVFWGLEICRTYEIKPSQLIILRTRPRRLFGQSIGPDLDDRGYEHFATMDYPLLPAGVHFYRRKRRPLSNPSTCHSERSDAQ